MRRFLDIALSSALLVVLGPVILIIAVLVHVLDGPPPFFRQTRIGQYGRPFVLIKIRTMTSEKVLDGMLLTDAERLTRIGPLLRSTSLDEIPQLWNVLKGEMSLIGPRPLLVEYLDRYTDVQSRRHSVRPGITGWAQVNGRNLTTWEERFELDLWYVDNRNFFLDLKIILMTLVNVLTQKGVNAGDEITIPLFQGTRSDKR